MASTYNLITSTILGSDTSSVTLSSIPSTYTDLVLRISARDNRNALTDSIKATYNLTGNIFSNTYLQGNGTTASSARNNGDGSFSPFNVSMDGNTATTNTFGSLEVYYPNYTVAQNHPYSSFGVSETSGTTGYIEISAQLMRSTGTISSITMVPSVGTLFLTGSSFYLYGIKNS